MNQPTASEPTLQELTRLVQEQQHRLAKLQKCVDTHRLSHRFPYPWLRRPSLMMFALVGLLIVITGLASASVPAASGVVTGCYNSKGALRVIDAEAGQQCSSKEKQVTWNQTGPTGAQGIPGLPGAMGARGLQGPAGPAGVSGIIVYRSLKMELHQLAGLLRV